MRKWEKRKNYLEKEQRKEWNWDRKTEDRNKSRRERYANGKKKKKTDQFLGRI